MANRRDEGCVVAPHAVLLNAQECAAIYRCHVSDWWGVARRSPILRRGKVKRGRRTFWRRSVVERWVEGGGR